MATGHGNAPDCVCNILPEGHTQGDGPEQLAVGLPHPDHGVNQLDSAHVHTPGERSTVTPPRLGTLPQ